MSIKRNVKILSVVVFLCLFSETTLGAQKNNLIVSSADINQLQDEAECIANTRQIRNIFASILKQKSVSVETVQKLDGALRKNLYFFEKYKDNDDIIINLFGAVVGVNASKEIFTKNYQQNMEDYDSFHNIVTVLMANVKNHKDIRSFATLLKIVDSLHPVVQNNVEWDEYLYGIVIDFSLASPLTILRYLDRCSQDEFDLFFRGIEWIYDTVEKRKELEAELAKISLKEKKYTKTVDKIISRMKEDCFKYYGNDAWVCKDWPE